MATKEKDPFPSPVSASRTSGSANIPVPFKAEQPSFVPAKAEPEPAPVAWGPHRGEPPPAPAPAPVLTKSDRRLFIEKAAIALYAGNVSNSGWKQDPQHAWSAAKVLADAGPFDPDPDFDK